MPVLRAGALYFVLVFTAGFVLGVMRMLLLVPRIGIRSAELLEMPFMAVAIFFAARWVIAREAVSPGRIVRVGMGLVALGLMVFVEFTVVLGIQDLTIADYVAHRDPIAGTAYLVMLGVFTIMPLLVARK
jgi:hypothetical protein